MTTQPLTYDRKAMYDAVMDAAYAFRPDSATPKIDGEKASIGEIVGTLSAPTASLSKNEQKVKRLLSDLATGVMQTVFRPNDKQARATLHSAQKALDADFFEHDSEAAGHREGVSRETHLLTLTMRHAAHVEKAQQDEARSNGASIV